MPIVQNISRKQGKINPAPTSVMPPKGFGGPFGPRGNAGANVGDAQNPSDPPVYVSSGVDYNQVSRTGGAKNPVGKSQNTATIAMAPMLSSYGQSVVVPTTQLPEVGPQEHGTFFSPQPQKDNPQRQSGGVSPTSNTPFHPQKTPVTRARRYPTPAGERTSAQSFGSSQYLTGNASQDSIVARGRTRWGQVKRGVIGQTSVPAATMASPVGGVVTGSGTTGVTGTGSKQSLKTPVHGNAHSGSPYVVDWTPNRRGVQPNEKGSTNPIKQKCVQQQAGKTVGPFGITW